jgi:multiple sugar transport system permease protein
MMGTGIRRGPRLLLFALLTVVMVVMLAPFVQMVATALAPSDALFQLPVTWFPQHARLANFVDVWTQVPLGAYLLNTLQISGGAVVVLAVTAIPAAYALSRFDFPGRRVFLHGVVSTQMFAHVVLLIAAFRLMTSLNLVNSLLGLILMNATTSLPFAVWTLTSYFATIPREIEEAAILDRAGRWRRLFDHFLPLAAPGLVTVLAFTFILAWNEFLFALTFISDDSMRPLTSGIYSFVGRNTVQWNYLMASSLIATVPVFCLFLVIQRRLVAGLTAGAVK